MNEKQEYERLLQLNKEIFGLHQEAIAIGEKVYPLEVEQHYYIYKFKKEYGGSYVYALKDKYGK